VKRLPTLAFAGLAVATVAAFFIIQHLKVTTPLITGVKPPFPAVIDPLGGGICVARTPDGPTQVNFSRTSLSFSLLHRSDNVYVYVVDQRGRNVATVASGVFMAGLPSQMTRTFTWDGRVYGGRPAPAGDYHLKVVLRRQNRTIEITNPDGALDRVRVEYNSRCPGA
jgi:hypothetical protein